MATAYLVSKQPSDNKGEATPLTASSIKEEMVIKLPIEKEMTIDY